MPWPTPQDYNEAIQNPAFCFADSQLMSGQVQLTPLGLPKAITGAFASVYRIQCGPAAFAVRCFLREVPDLQQRYAAISAHLQRANLPYTVGFEYLPNGIRLQGNWYPVLKMEWVQGEQLNSYIAAQRNNPAALRALADAWLRMATDLGREGIAHGDLQHGNILVAGNEIRLIDYDGMYVPALRGRNSNELGHRNYQHPARNSNHFAPWLDNFSLWLIYLSLLALAADQSLWPLLHPDDEHLLLRKEDLEHPTASTTWNRLLHSPDAQVRDIANALLSYLSLPLAQVPTPDSQPPVLRPAARSGVLKPPKRATPAPSGFAGPDWVLDQIRLSQAISFSDRGLAWDRGLLGGTTFAYGILARLIITRLQDPSLVGPLILGGGLTVGSLLAIRYWRKPQTRSKRRIQLRLQLVRWHQTALEARLGRLAEEREHQEARRRQVLSDLDRQLHDLSRQRSEALRQLTGRLDAIAARLEADLDRSRARFHARRRQLAAAARERAVQQCLLRHRLLESGLPRFDRQLLEQLRRKGIDTAADIVAIHRVPRLQGSTLIYIDVRGGRPTAFPELNSAQARDLENWRDELRQRYLGEVSFRLPTTGRLALQFGQSASLWFYEWRLELARRAAEKQAEKLERDYAQRRSAIFRRQRNEMDALQNTIQELSGKLTELQGQLQQVGGEARDLAQEMRLYSEISFVHYLRRLCWLPQRRP